VNKLLTVKATGASMRRHASVQTYATPPDFMAAVAPRFGKPAFDLAASTDNTKAARFYSEADDSLKQSWHKLGGWLWLNPPFSDIAPWAEKCAAEMRLGARILFLTPASVGANWFQRHVVPNAHVLELSPRLSFDGHQPYPKDLVLSVFCCSLTGRSHWAWK
jgi:phage N-6-adenine-methyltransferase